MRMTKTHNPTISTMTATTEPTTVPATSSIASAGTSSTTFTSAATMRSISFLLPLVVLSPTMVSSDVITTASTTRRSIRAYIRPEYDRNHPTVSPTAMPSTMHFPSDMPTMYPAVQPTLALSTSPTPSPRPTTQPTPRPTPIREPYPPHPGDSVPPSDANDTTKGGRESPVDPGRDNTIEISLQIMLGILSLSCLIYCRTVPKHCGRIYHQVFIVNSSVNAGGDAWEGNPDVSPFPTIVDPDVVSFISESFTVDPIGSSNTSNVGYEVSHEQDHHRRTRPHSISLDWSSATNEWNSPPGTLSTIATKDEVDRPRILSMPDRMASC